MNANRLLDAANALREASAQVYAASPYVDRSVEDAIARLNALGFGSCPVAEAFADWLEWIADEHDKATPSPAADGVDGVVDAIFAGGDPS